MSRLGTIARRGFLVGAAAIAGGVAFGVWAVRRPHANPLLGELGPGEAALTPYVKITRAGVTLITPRADMGQGAYSIQAAMIAEELDVELDEVTVDPGPPSPAYWNTALAAEGVPFASWDDSLPAEAARALAGAGMKLVGLQVTGGSSTVPDSHDKLRQAGAVARETLKAAAAARTGVPVAELRTEAGRVLLPGGGAIAYTDLAEAAGAREPAADVPLRAPSEWRLLGRPMRRIDIVAKSTGTARYGIDLAPEGMLHATIVTNPRPGGERLAYDATTAEAMRGVVRVVPVTGGVAVLADNTWRAFRGAAAVEAEWGPAPFPPEQAAHWRALSESFTDDRQDSRLRDDGDVAAALAEGADVEAEYRAPYLAHAPLEPVNATVLVTGARVDVWTGTQVPRFVQRNVAAITGHAAEQVHVHVLPMGGSFGHRLEDDVVRRAAEAAMAVPGTPVKTTLRREEDMAHDYPRQIAMARARGGVRDGRVDSLDLRIAMPSVTQSQMGRQGFSPPGPDPAIVLGAYDQPFDLPHCRVTGYRAPPLAPVSSWRAVGASTNVFFHESALDELIHAAGADPLEERLRLVDHAPSRAVLEAVGEMCGWAGRAIGAGRGRGLAFGFSFGVPVAEVVDVTVTERGLRLDDVWVAADVGRVLDPVNFEGHVQGGVVWALGHAIAAETTFADGRAEQVNYDRFPGMRMGQVPRIHVRALETAAEVRGIGEPMVPPAAPALAAAIFAATGTRLREMPFRKAVAFA